MNAAAATAPCFIKSLRDGFGVCSLGSSVIGICFILIIELLNY
jgi:hypothetical protein